MITFAYLLRPPSSRWIGTQHCCTRINEIPLMIVYISILLSFYVAFFDSAKKATERNACEIEICNLKEELGSAILITFRLRFVYRI